MLGSPTLGSQMHFDALFVWLDDNGYFEPGAIIARPIPGKPPKRSCVEYEFPEISVTVRVYENLTVEDVEES